MKGAPIDYAIIVIYFFVILGFGSFFGKFTKNTKDFFFGGQRFSWWLLAASLIATTVGSYSFVKYSRMAYQFGVSSSMTYLNDWFWMPLFLFGWLPIVYYARVASIPEYFQRRFNTSCRVMATFIILLYMVGYVGINFYTMGKALYALLGWPVFTGAVVVAVISAIYVTAGGQTAVIMTDLFQGVLLLVAGVAILVLGVDLLGGWGIFYDALPPDHRLGLAHFNDPPNFNFVGVFWQDGMANGIAAYFFNQGIIMRFLSAKSVADGRKAVSVMVLVLMPLAAIAVGGAGWIGRAMTMVGVPLDNYSPGDIFVTVSNVLCHPGIFGLVMAAMTAALMSTADTLINAVAAISVNDIVRPYLVKDREDRYYLSVARWVSVGAAVLGILLVPVYMSFGSIYAAHGAFTAAVAPPMAVTLLLGAFWRRFNSKAAFASMLGGILLMVLSFIVPDIIAPLADLHGVEKGGEYLKAHFFMRALFGVVVTMTIGVTVTLVTRQDKDEEELTGLVWGTIRKSMWLFKSGEPNEAPGKSTLLDVERVEQPDNVVRVPKAAMDRMAAQVGDLGYICHKNRMYGGLRSVHCRFGMPLDDGAAAMIPSHLLVEGTLSRAQQVRMEKIL